MKHQPRRRFGQNFLHDKNVIGQIVDAIDPIAGEKFVEIGPGQGALTLPLLEHDIELRVIEIDRDLAARWETLAATRTNFQVHCADALTVAPQDIYPDGAGFRLVGNLPYNVSTPLLFHFVEWREHVQDLHLMLQKEVVDRMCAEPGNRIYGRLTVMLSPHFQIEKLLHVGSGAFRPAPKVDSAFARLTPHASPPFELDDLKAFSEVVAAAFSMRRKTLRNGVRKLLETAQIEACDVDPGARPETLSPADFAKLANALSQHRRQIR